jgi:outer membrane protein OmpA-like peptidoglycan-associated protein
MVARNDSIEKLAAEMKSKAAKFDRQNDVYNAIYYYNRYLLYKHKDIKLNYRLAKLYFDTREYRKAYQYFDSVLHLSKTKFPLTYYYKGIVCINLEKYDEAVDVLTKFRKVYKENKKNNYRRLASIYIESATWAKSQPEANGDIQVNHPGMALNHSNIDFAPFPIDESTLLYGSVYSDTTKHIGPVRQIYKAIKTDAGWKSAGLMEGEINNPSFNTGNAIISGNGRHLYFTRSRKNWQNIDISEIYRSKLVDDVWQTPEKLPYPVNDENYTTTQPAIGRNMRTGNEVLFFVSNRAEGKGGLDIWYTEFDKKTSTWKEPQSLDKNVNTADDECCPFYDELTSTLYFSSKGKKTQLGGYDIFKATGSTKKWTEAMPLPKPVNSSFDDYYFSILPNNKEGYFTSNRPGSANLDNGSCCDDIYSFKINECFMVFALGTIRSSVNYDIYDELNEKYHLGLEYPKDSTVLNDVPVELYLSGDSVNDEILVSQATTDERGRYHFSLEKNKQYKVLVKNYGFFEKKVPVNTVGVNCNDTLKITTTHISYLPKVNIRINIYYAHNEFRLSNEAKSTIDTTLVPLFELFPNAIIEIGSHTDSTGTDQYNIKLSQRRSESVVNYLISKGISSERLVAKGYGMRLPVAPNTHMDGSDNPEGRKLNRRTEIKIVGEISTFNKEE